jgi:sulfur carrier protein
MAPEAGIVVWGDELPFGSPGAYDRMTMEIVVNGKPHALPGALSLRQFLETLRLPTLERGVAVSLNGEVVRRAEWERTALKAQDEVEIVQATQGG